MPGCRLRAQHACSTRSSDKDDDELRLALIRLAKQYGRYGYRKVGELLQAEGWRVNHKKVERLGAEEGLQLPHRHKKRKRLYHHDASVIRLRAKIPEPHLVDRLRPRQAEQRAPLQDAHRARRVHARGPVRERCREDGLGGRSGRALSAAAETRQAGLHSFR